MKKKRVRDKFLKELEKIPIVQVACERVGISRQTVYRWRNEDPEFLYAMGVALNQGEELLNDVAESQLFALVKDKNFSAIRYHLSRRHPKYKEREKNPEDVEYQKTKFEADKIIKELGLTPEDFSDENIDRSVRIITEHLEKY